MTTDSLSAVLPRPDARTAGAEPSLPAGLELADVRRATDGGWPWRGLAVALLAHGAVLAALISGPFPEHVGGGVVLDAIEVSVIDGRAFEALALARQVETAPAARAEAEDAVRTDAENARAVADARAEPRGPQFSLRQAEDDELIAAGANAATSPKRLDGQAQAAALPAAVETASVAGGATARGADVTAREADAGTRAPEGVAHDYALSVAMVLARNKPAAPGPKGTARVRFTVGQDGSVAEAAVLASSGHASLDSAALAAVRRSRFPAPPVVLTRADTTFDLPFHFR